MEYEYLNTLVGSVVCKDLLYFPLFLNTVDSFMGFPQFLFISGNCDKSISCVYDYTQFCKGELTSYIVCQEKKKRDTYSYSSYMFAFPACNTSAKTPIRGLTECLTHCHGGLHTLASGQGNHFTANEVQQWDRTHGIHWFYHVPHHPEATGSREQWNSLLKVQL